MPLKCSTHIAPADVPCIRPPAPPFPESPRLPVMTVNGMRPDADGNVSVVILGMADVAAEVAKETERAKAEEAKNASAAKTAAAKADEAQTSLDDHVANAHNPHNVTATQVGALPVNNTDKELKFGILTGKGISLAGTFYDDTDPRMVKLRFAEASSFGSGMDVKGRISLTKNSEFPEFGNGELLVNGVNVMDAIDSKAGKSDLVGVVQFVEDDTGEKTAVTIGIRKSSAPIGAFSLANGTFVTASGHSSHVEGDNTTASGTSSHAEGTYTTALGEYSHSEGNSTTAAGVCSHAEGEETRADGHASHAEGYRSHTRVEDAYAFAWNGDDARADQYVSHGKGTFNVNPVGGSDGFYVGEKKLSEVILGSVTNNISAENPAFSNAVLAVGLNIDTNSVSVLNEIAKTFGGFPLGAGETATTVGGLLAALAAAVAWLKKNKVQTLKLNDNSVETSADGGVAKLDDFFTESNSLLTGLIESKTRGKADQSDLDALAAKVDTANAALEEVA